MKIFASFILLILFLFGSVKAQEAVIINKDSVLTASRDMTPVAVVDTTSRGKPSIYGWTISQRFGTRTSADRDTASYNFHQLSLMDGKDIAVSYLGNVGSPAQSMIFFNRAESNDFNFLNAFDYYLKRPDNHVFLNTKMPNTNILYQAQSFSSPKAKDEERFKADMSWNPNKAFNIGFNVDYIYARGNYNSMASKQFAYDVYASYISPKYEMHAFAYNNNFVNSENGGIRDMSVITDKVTNDNINDTKSIETNYTNAWNRVRGRQLYLNNRYNLGLNEKDSVPIATLLLTTYYMDQQRKFISNDNVAVSGGLTAMDTLYAFTGENNYAASNQTVDDRMSYWSLTNTFGISLNEGFKPWVKFGLTGFIEHNISKYQYPATNTHFLGVVETQNTTRVGGELAKQKGKFLRYNFSGDIAVLGERIGEFRLKGNLKTLINIKGKDAEIGAEAYIKNLKPTFFESRFQSKYFSWNNGGSSPSIDIGDMRRVYVGGEIFLPQTQTRIRGGVENIQNLRYYGSNRYIAQEGDNVQVFALQVEQKLKAGILHWDNKVAYQVSSNQTALPLPTLSVYSNLYLQTHISKVLKFQMGVDAHLFTEYYAPGYDAALLQFYNQRSVKIGNFPIATAYIDFQMKSARFYVMMYNVAKSMGNAESFTVPYYPVNPMVFKWGISWDFAN